MKKMLKKIRKMPKVYSFLKSVYGKTIGFWWLKDWYVKNVGFYNGKKKIRLLNDHEANKIMIAKIKSGRPFMLARYGSVELRNLFYDDEMDTLCLNAGFFPNDKKLLQKFRNEYFEASKLIDILAIWNYQSHFLNKMRWLENFPNIKHLAPLSASGSTHSSWRNELKGKRILVIHPFKKTIEAQHKKRAELGILPKIKNLQVIKAVQTIAGNKDDRFKDWFEALEFMKREIDKKDFDIALVGCGAYGLPLAAYIKSIGKQALHVGGGLQLFFGIKGKRWHTDSNIKYNKHWMSPMEEDIVGGFKKIEGGCYW